MGKAITFFFHSVDEKLPEHMDDGRQYLVYNSQSEDTYICEYVSEPDGPIFVHDSSVGECQFEGATHWADLRSPLIALKSLSILESS